MLSKLQNPHSYWAALDAEFYLNLEVRLPPHDVLKGELQHPQRNLEAELDLSAGLEEGLHGQEYIVLS